MSLRLSEKWFRRALWLIAALFAIFLINLTGLVVEDLPGMPPSPSLDSYMDPVKTKAVQTKVDVASAQIKENEATLNELRPSLQEAQLRYANASDTFNSWLATRQATGEEQQNAALVARTQALESLKIEVQASQQKMATIEQNQAIANQHLQNAQGQLEKMTQMAQHQWQAGYRLQEWKVFLLRCTITLPLLVVAGYLWVKKRKSVYWPFVWGFVFFALYTFFIELVPYLPQYGGYVHYSVGVVLTFIVGRYLIGALQRYQERQKNTEQLPEQQRHQALSYDLAQKRFTQNICPGCERPCDCTDATHSFCMHCGICLFNECLCCHARKNAFAHYCQACGNASA